MAGISAQTNHKIITITVGAQVDLCKFAGFINKNMQSWNNNSVIWNLASMDFQDIASKDITLFVYNTLRSLEGGKCDKIAIIAPQNVQYGMMMVFMAFAEATSTQIQFRVFRETSRAEDWLTEDKETVSS